MNRKPVTGMTPGYAAMKIKAWRKRLQAAGEWKPTDEETYLRLQGLLRDLG